MTEYTADLQKLFLEMMVQDTQTYVRVQNIYNAENFDRSLRQAAEFIFEHTEQYSTMPDLAQIKAVSGTELSPVPNLDEGHITWFMDEFELFTKRQELNRAILKASDLIEDGDYDPVEKLIKDAVQISLTKDMGIDYFDDPRSRLMALKDNNGQISTGWPALDQKLYGGFNKGELNIFAGTSGSGKSLFMQNLAVNWANMGLNGVYLTLELSEGLSAMRIDSMMVDVGTREIFKNLDDVELKLGMARKNAGTLRIKYMQAQSTVNDIRAYIRELQIQTGETIDFLLVDYLDLIMPVSVKVNPNDTFIKDKYVAEELRNLANELRILFVTASQLNRSAVEEVEFDHSMIAGGISKINTADNVIGIFTSRAMRERGRYQIQLMKTRSSSGVGSKVDLDFDVNTLRITASAEDDSSSYGNGPPSSDIMDKLKQKGETVDTGTGEITKVPKAEVQSNKLKNMLADLKSGSV